MTLRDAIIKLEATAKKHGDETLLYFDCPDCRKAFTPDVVVMPSVVMKAKPKVEQ